MLSDAKLLKEQTRAKNKETLLEIINSAEVSDEQKQAAIDSMVQMTAIAEKEAAAEILLEARMWWSASTVTLWTWWSMRQPLTTP